MTVLRNVVVEATGCYRLTIEQSYRVALVDPIAPLDPVGGSRTAALHSAPPTVDPTHYGGLNIGGTDDFVISQLSPPMHGRAKGCTRK